MMDKLRGSDPSQGRCECWLSRSVLTVRPVKGGPDTVQRALGPIVFPVAYLPKIVGAPATASY